LEVKESIIRDILIVKNVDMRARSQEAEDDVIHIKSEKGKSRLRDYPSINNGVMSNVKNMFLTFHLALKTGGVVLCFGGRVGVSTKSDPVAPPLQPPPHLGRGV
jgi:hypothetical protein